MSEPGGGGFDPYKVLQVAPEADQEIIQLAYRRLAQKWHPDVAPGEEAGFRMVAINRAWEVLGDPVRRSAYDRAHGLGRRVAPAAGSATAGSAAGSAPETPAHRPPGRPSGSVLNFGRYSGWSLGEIALSDLVYVEWLDRMPIGRPYRDEIDAILRRAGRRTTAAAEVAERHGLFRRR